MKLKIISYNILNGFSTDKLPYEFEKDRMIMASKIIESQTPDILVLTGGYLWPFAKKVSMNNFSKEFSKIYNFYEKPLYSFRWAPVLLTKYEIIKYDSSMSKFHLNYLRSIIKIKNKILIIDVFHPHPSKSENDKVDFLKDVFSKHKLPDLLIGDLNSFSLKDDYDKNKLLRGYSTFMKNPQEKINDLLSGNTITFMENNKLIDTYKVINSNFDFTIPTNLLSTNKDSACRIDFIFCSNKIQVLNSGIIKTKQTEEASDHFPIYAELEIK